MHRTVKQIIGEIREWEGADIRVEPQEGGLTNRNFHIHVNDKRHVLRVSGGNTELLNINREAERAAALLTSQAGLAPQVVYFSLPEGHMVTRFIEGHEPSPKEFREPDMIRRLADFMKRVHALPPIEHQFCPFHDVRTRIEAVKTRGIDPPFDLSHLLAKMAEVEREEAADPSPMALCHNDPFPNNFLDNGSIYLLDWEFAGMGNIYFDLACVATFFAPEQQELLLKCYFGDVTEDCLRRMWQMRFMVHMWNGAWALVQMVASDVDLNYRQMAEQILRGGEAYL